MPVVTESVEFRRPRSQFAQLISESENPSHEARCKSTISSLLLSTFSNEPQPAAAVNGGATTPSKKKNGFGTATFRGLGCSAGSSQQVSVPAVIRSSADWDSKKARKRKAKKKGKDRNALLEGPHSCVDFQDVWCGPGIGFSAADAAASVDCVVARRNGVARGKIDGEKVGGHRERPCIARRSVIPEPTSFFDSEPEFLSERPGSEVFGGRYFRHVRHPSSEGFAEIMMLQSGLIMGGRVDLHDRFRDMRLDVDHMSYEELLDLGERIGYVNTGLKEDEISRCIRKLKLSLSNDWPRVSTQVDRKCIICQEEYEGKDEIGKLECGHGFHDECIRHWLAHKNTCPVCKAEAVARRC